MLTTLAQTPAGLLDCAARDLHRILPGPTLLHLPGRRPQPLFVSVLLHGNETTGLAAVQSLLRKYRDRPLPRALSILFGNVSAAREGWRHLDGQPDYNRIWPYRENETDGDDDSPEHRMMQTIVDDLHRREVFASIDVHNNTGLNPHYGCINHLDATFLHLATQFSRTVVYFTRPRGVQSMAFATLCPAVTVECGKPDQPFGADHALAFIDTCLHLDTLPDSPVAARDIDLFHTVATVTIPGDIGIDFGDGGAQLHLNPDLDHLNFREIPAGTVLGRVNKKYPHALPLVVTNETGAEVTDRYFTLADDEIRTTRRVMPSMFTLDAGIIHQDCLGYLMERIDSA
jgi:succinylglutamate desuccinylase